MIEAIVTSGNRLFILSAGFAKVITMTMDMLFGYGIHRDAIKVIANSQDKDGRFKRPFVTKYNKMCHF